MSTPINLNKFRKQKAGADKRATADANSVRFGRTKAARDLDAAREAKAKALLEGHRLGPTDEDGA